MAVPEYIIEQVRNSNDIVAVISEYIILKKTGANYKALCPFHKEKTPSFVISPEKQICHCFSCGEGGNVFNFMMKYEKISFFEALKKLANRSGIVIPEEEGRKYSEKNKEEKELIFEVNRLAAMYYHDFLKNNSLAAAAREYLKKRKINQDILDKFIVGYAPATFEEMLKLGNQHKYSQDLLKKAGLIMFNEKKNSYIDKFIDRIIFPISDYDGRVIAFGGRTLKDIQPKYLNSSDTPVFNKSRVLYGLDIAKSAIREKGSMIIVEGYMDVITAHQYGFNNTVATMGTALTEENAFIIPRYTEKVSLMYDGDEAGLMAALRGIDVLVNTGLRITVTALPDKSDPDSFLHARGREEFNNQVEGGMDVVDFKIITASRGVDMNKTDNKIFVAQNVLPLIARMTDYIKQEEGIKKLSEAIKVPRDILRQEMAKSDTVKSVLKKNIDKACGRIKAEIEQERLMVQVLLKYPDLAEVAFKDNRINSDIFNDSVLAEIFLIMSKLYKQGKPAEPAVIMNYAQSGYITDKELVEGITKAVSSMSLGKMELRTPEKVLRNSMEDYYRRAKERKKYYELKSQAVSCIDRNEPDKHEKLKQYVEQYKILKGTNN